MYPYPRTRAKIVGLLALLLIALALHALESPAPGKRRPGLHPHWAVPAASPQVPLRRQ